MFLKQILKEILEQPNDVEDLVNFPNQNISLHIDRNEKKMTFAPQEPKKPAPKSKVIVKSLEEKFKVRQIKQESNDILEVSFDPIEDFESAVDFVKSEIVK